MMEDFFVFLYISTTSDEHQVCVSRDAGEIIELAWSIVETSKLNLHIEAPESIVPASSRASVLVRPNTTPITELCTSSTGLTWNDVAQAGTLLEAIRKLQDSIQASILLSEATFAFIILDSRDLQGQLTREALEKSIILPDYLAYPRFYSLQEEFGKWQNRHPNSASSGPVTCFGMCEALSIATPYPPGAEQGPDMMTRVPVRADHNCSALLRITLRLLQEGQSTQKFFSLPTDLSADLRVFLKENSKVLHLSGLAYDTTQSELESWFTQHGGRPIAFWTFRTPEQHKPTGIGFAIFVTHMDAKESLNMNGRLLADRTICVSPSSASILERAGEILTPFPPSKNRPRPGDWTCPSCGFSNFQRRTACFRCSYPSNAALDPGPYYPSYSALSPMTGYPPGSSTQGMVRMGGNGNGGGGGNGGHVPFRAGDWSCQACAYHNFARNSVCLKCSMPRAQQDMNGMVNYHGYAGDYRMNALTDDMARQML